MPQATKTVAPKTWVLLTDTDITGAHRIQNMSSQTSVLIKATANATAPTNADGAFKLPSEGVIASPQTLQTLFPTVTSVKRVWAYSQQATVAVSVDYV